MITMVFIAITIIGLCSLLQTHGLTFSQQPFNATIEAGGTVSLTCIVEADTLEQDYEMRWEKDGEKISTNANVRNDLIDLTHYLVTISKGNRRIVYSFVFTNVWNNDRGLYSCTVYRNNIHVLESDKAFINVLQIPNSRYPLCTTSENIYKEGDDVNLYCTSEHTQPAVTLQWVGGATNIVEILDGIFVRLQKKFTAVPELHGYTAVCSLTNSLIPSLNRNCTTRPLTIYYKPRVNISQTGSILVGKQALFICKSRANPSVTRYRWKTVPQLDNAEYNVDNTEVLILLNPTIEYNGMIVKCTAENQIGRSSYNITLVVETYSQKTVVNNNGNEREHEDLNSDRYHPNDNSSRDDVKDKHTSSGLSLDVIVIIIVVSVVVLVILVMIPVYYYCLCSRKSPATQTVVVQPDVYFEPRDRMTLPLPKTRESAMWRRSFAAQAPDDREVDAMYLEIQSNHYIYATTSRCNTIR